MMIDGHAHACGIYLTEQSILENMKKQGVDKVILSPGECGSSKNYSLPDLGKLFKTSKLIYWNNKLTCKIIERSKLKQFLEAENERLAVLAEKHPECIFNTYWINMDDKECVEKMKAFYEKHAMTMLKLHQCWTPFEMADVRVKKIIEWAAMVKKPIFIHLYSKEQVKALIDLAAVCQEADFIVGHLIGIEEFDRSVRGANIYFDISCPELHSVSMLRRAYELAGAERIVLGSDSPYGKNNIHKAVAQLKKIGLSSEEMAMVCAGNLIKLLHLPD